MPSLRCPKCGFLAHRSPHFDRCTNPCSLYPPPAALAGVARGARTARVQMHFIEKRDLNSGFALRWCVSQFLRAQNLEKPTAFREFKSATCFNQNKKGCPSGHPFLFWRRWRDLNSRGAINTLPHFESSVKKRTWRNLTEDNGNKENPENLDVFRGFAVFMSKNTVKIRV